MKIRMTFDLGDEDRRIIASYYGDEGKASRDTCIGFINAMVTSDIEALSYNPNDPWEEEARGNEGGE